MTDPKEVTRQNDRSPQFTPIQPPENQRVELFAKIKRTSEYYHQGLDQDGKPCIFKIDGIRSGYLAFRLNYNNYGCHDLAFYVKDSEGQLIPLSGGARR